MRPALLAITCCVLAACANGPDLSAVPVPGFQLSGTWQLIAGESDPAPQPRRILDRANREAVERGPSRSAARTRVRGAMFAFINQDFPVLAADKMLIEQNTDSMGIGYDPGGYRDITWGKRERQLWDVNAGWDETGALVIDSRSGDLRALERMQLDGSGRLEVLITISDDNQRIERRRVFERI